MYKNKFLLSVLLMFVSYFGFSQSFEGYVLDEYNQPIPFAKVYVKNYANVGAITNIEGFYQVAVDPGNYEVIYSSLGFVSVTKNVTVTGFDPVKVNANLTTEYNELEIVEISEKKKNVGYEIIKNVIANKKNLEKPFDGYSCEIYIKGSETYDVKEKRNKTDDNETNGEPTDVFDEEQKKINEKIDEAGGGRLNLVEIAIDAHFQYPNKLKEFKTAYSKIGNPELIFLRKSPVTQDAYFNFYDNLLVKENLHETPIVSPLHISGILSYKYKLEEIITQGIDTIYRVHISPRSFGTTTMEGDLYVKKHEWVLTKVDVSMHKGNLKQYDDFRIVQNYVKRDSVWLVDNQHFYYSTKYAKETVIGETTVNYKNYILNPEFGEKYFNNEVGITTSEAYKRDSTYWNKVRPEPLTVEEQRKKFVQDSLKAAYTKKEYLDSIDAVFNQLTFMKVAFFGLEGRNRHKKTQWWLSSVTDLIEPFGIAGPRIGPGFGAFKKFENEQWMDFNSDFTIGVLNKDPRGYARFYHRYMPKKFATYMLYYSHNVAQIVGNAPWLDQVDPSNYYFRDILGGSHNFEIVNGLFLNAGVNWEKRSSLVGLKFYKLFEETLQVEDPIGFDPYFAFRTNISLSYTPGQKYITEPNKKIILGSKWPTFSIYHEKGFKNVLGSSADFDYLSFGISQEFNIGTIGKSIYRVNGGSFVNQDSIYYIDRKFFRASDVGIYGWLMSDPLHSFQNLKGAYETRQWYGQAHFIHHFNGAIINKIPFMKKTGIKSVAGGGILFLPEYNNFLYQEMFFGLERVFKMFRKRVRIGGFAIFSDSNAQTPKLQFKLAFDVMDERDLKFNF